MSVFLDVENIPFESSVANGSQSINTGDLAIGNGSQVFRADQSGIWLGANQFADAPFSVDMLGNLIASSATLTGFSKVAIFAQDEIPTSGAIGDLWVDTNNSNKVYRAASVGADAVVEEEWVEVTVDAILKQVTGQTLSGNFNLNDSNVLIDGANSRILINDGTNNRIVIGEI